MAKITGKTFDHRETLKSYGAKWNNDGKYWTVDDATAERIKALNLAAVIVTMTGEAEPAPALKPAPVVSTRSKRTTFYGNNRDLFNAFVHKNPITFAGFDTFGDLVDFAEKIPVRRGSGGSAWVDGDEGFSGTRTFAEAIKIAREGWNEGVEMARRAVEVLSAEHPVRKERFYSTAGGRVNVGRLMAGNPMHMLQRKRSPSKKVITLYVAMGMIAAVSAADAASRAAAVAALADILEQSGYSCEIIGVHTSNTRWGSDKAGFHVTAILKRAGEVLNLADLVYAFGHPAVMRRLLFAIFAANDAAEPYWIGMGATVSSFHETEPGSFYIRQLEGKVDGAGFDNRVRAIFEKIVPADLPVKLTA